MTDENTFPITTVTSASSLSDIPLHKRGCQDIHVSPSNCSIKKLDDDIAALDLPPQLPKQLNEFESEFQGHSTTPILRFCEPRLAPSFRPRASKRSAMTWPGCR
ncbi:hypothetical protein DPMN_185446 [Dreissena polymorpha]|uniref:Uncharacterized protein n=1 Tax=Dreissena polymorpha TaxID=45954 RepID=A0A9D4I8D9_DREPO|nr:hypothetical protein DPMN_185446 [Dreissena polymorpha]